MKFVKCFLIFIFIFSVNVFADEIGVAIDGAKINFSDAHPVVSGGRTLVPVRGVFEELGFSVEWNDEEKSATLSRASTEVVITLDSDVFTVNGESRALEVPAQIIGGRTMLPIRAVLESVGYDIDWNAETRTINIVAKGAGAGAAVATINGLNIGANDVTILLADAEWVVLRERPEDFDRHDTENEIRKEAVRLAAVFVLFAEYAAENGITLSAEDLKEVDEIIKDILRDMTEEEFLEMLIPHGFISIAHYARVGRMYSLMENVIESIIEDPEKFAPFEQYLS